MKEYYRTWTKEQNDFIIQNHTLTQKEIAGKLGKSLISINNRLRWLRSKGLVPMKKGGKPIVYSKYGEKLKDIISDYKLYGFDFCVNKYNISLKEIRNIASTLGILKKEAPKPKINYIFNEDLIESPTEEFAYILGIIWGDGYLTKIGKGNRVGIAGVYADYINILPYLLKLGNWQYSLCSKQSKDGIKRKPQIKYSFTNKIFKNFLVSKNYLNKKDQSCEAILDYLPLNLRKFWWRGFFDADGHCSFTITHNMYIKAANMNLTSSYAQNWSEIEKLSKQLGISNYSIYRSISKKGHKNSQYRCQQASEIFKFLNYIYDDYKNIGFARKYINYIDLKRYLEYKDNNQYFYRHREYAPQQGKEVFNEAELETTGDVQEEIIIDFNNQLG